MSLQKNLIENSGRIAIFLGFFATIIYYIFGEKGLKEIIFTETTLGSLIFGLTVMTISYFILRRLDREFGNHDMKLMIQAISLVVTIIGLYIKFFPI